MIVVRVELHSAVTRQVTELARMEIANDGRASTLDPRKGDYTGRTLKGRCRHTLDRREVTRTGGVQDYPRQSLHVWNLVARMLASMGYR